MSLGKLVDLKTLSSEFEGLSEKEIKDRIHKKFYSVYGRYESSSGRMWFEVYHDDAGIRWRKGTDDTIEEDTILQLEEALPRFMSALNKGYELNFNGTTQSDMDKGNALRLEKQSNAQREGWLGDYFKGKHFFRISQFDKDVFFIERGYSGAVTSTSKETEAGAKFELRMAHKDGFRRKGEEIAVSHNPLAVFGIGDDEPETPEVEEGAFPFHIFE